MHTTRYDNWDLNEKSIIKDFLLAIFDPHNQSPSLSEQWKTFHLYMDQTRANVNINVFLGLRWNNIYSHGKVFNRLMVLEMIKNVVTTL
jgi:hypothetical protein